MLRIPLQAFYVNNVANTASSNATFVIPFNDLNGVVAKFTAASFSGNLGAPTPQTLDVYIQATDDGGSTWYDCGHFAQVRATVSNAAAKWLTIPIDIGDGAGVADATAQSITANTVSGLPLMGSIGRVQWVFANGGQTSVANHTVTLYANSSGRS